MQYTAALASASPESALRYCYIIEISRECEVPAFRKQGEAGSGIQGSPGNEGKAGSKFPLPFLLYPKIPAATIL